MKTIDKKRVVSYQTDDNLFRVSVTLQVFDGIKGYDICASFNGVSVGNVFIDREEDLVMLAAALEDYVESRNFIRKEKQNEHN